MGASVGVGGLIVGISMLVVFSMAYQSITMQIDSGLERIENADDPIPTFTLDDAELWEGAVVDISITGAGAGYTDGTFAASSGTGGLQGTFTTNSGSITSMVITSHGNYSSARRCNLRAMWLVRQPRPPRSPSPLGMSSMPTSPTQARLRYLTMTCGYSLMETTLPPSPASTPPAFHPAGIPVRRWNWCGGTLPFRGTSA